MTGEALARGIGMFWGAEVDKEGNSALIFGIS